MAESTRYIAHRSAGRMGLLIGLLIACGLIFVLVDFSALMPDMMTTSGRRRARGLAAILQFLPWFGWFAIIVALAFVPKMLRKGVEIEVGPEGITYPPALNAVLPWDRIALIAVRKMSIYRVLAVHISDAENFAIKPMARKIAKLNKTSGDYGDINIETNRSDGNFDELLAAVELYCEVER